MNDTVVNSGADLVAMAPPDLFSSAVADSPSDTETSSTDTPVETSDAGDAGELETFDTPEPDSEPPGEETEQPTDEPEEPVDESAPAEQETKPATSETPADELPEGVVRGKDRNGKPGLFVEDGRWKNIYGNHQMVQRVSEMIGETATPEALQLRHNAYIAQERLFGDLLSGDPQAQGAVLSYFLDEMTRAREEGEVGGDPSIPMAQTWYTTLKEKAPDAYANVRFSAARDLVAEMFEEAGAKGDESLWLSAQHFARALSGVGKEVTDAGELRKVAERMGIPFYAKAEMQGLARGADPVERLRAENARLHGVLNGRTETNQAAQFDSWFQGVSKSVSSSVLSDAVKPALTSVEKDWQQFPNDYQDLVVDRLHRKVVEVIRADAGFNQRIKLLNDQAKRATSAQKREELGATIRQAFVNRAKLATEGVKRPILEFAANRLKERADQTHARRQAGQNRTAPNGSTGTVPRSILPKDIVQMKDGEFDSATAVKQARQLLGG